MSGKISESVNPISENKFPVPKDKDIREPLFDFLEEHYGKIRDYKRENSRVRRRRK